MASYAVQEFRAGTVINHGGTILAKNFIPFALIAVLAVLPIVAIGLIAVSMGAAETVSDEVWGMVAVVLFVLLYYFVTAAVTYGTYRELRGNRATVGECVARGLGRMLPVLGVAILSTLAMGAGFLLLIVPGFIVMTMLWVAVPVAVMERPGVVASLKRSSGLTKGYRWPIFGILLLLGILDSGTEKLFELMSDGESLLVDLFGTAVTVILILLGAVVAAVGYFHLRMIKDGVDIDEIAAVFD